jgi:SSS family transporter
MGRFGTLNTLILIVYMVASVAIGVWFTRRQRSLTAYFVANRTAPWWAAGLSIIATDLSAISYLGAPAWAFEKDLRMAMALFLFPLSMVLVVYLFVPFMARLRLFTIYEYLGERFNAGVRSVASVLFLFIRGGWLANVIFAQGLALSEITSISLTTSVWLIGGVSALYTVLGGMEAVLWTDVMQFFVLVGGILVVMGAILWSFGGDVGQIWSIAAAGGHTRLISFDVDLTTEVTIWALIVGGLVGNLSSYGSDQVIVQRYFTTRNKGEMARAILFNGLLVVPITLALYLIGTGLFAYYQANPPAVPVEPRRVLAYFIVNDLRPGYSGLVIAGLFAATMSSLSSGMNSLSTATYMDFIARFRSRVRASETDHVRTARLCTLGWGAAATIAALYVDRLGTLIEITGKINGFFSGPLLGMFLLGILNRRATSFGVMTGALIGTVVTAVAAQTALSWIWYGPVGCLATVSLGSLVSLVPMRRHSP